MKLLLILAFLTMSGCTDIGFQRSKYQEKLDNWVGKSAAMLYEDWGMPMQVSRVDTSTVLASYYQSESQPIDNVFEPYESEMSYDAMAVPDYGLPLAPPLFYCKTTFVIKNNIVTGYNFNGDDCY